MVSCCPDSASNCASDKIYTMHPSSASGIKSFSLCSTGNVCCAISCQSIETSCVRLSDHAQEASWIEKNKAVVVAVPTALGSAMILALVAFCVCRFRRKGKGGSIQNTKLTGLGAQVEKVLPLR